LAEWQRNLEPFLRKDASAELLLSTPSEVLNTSTGPMAIVVDQFEDLFKYGKRTKRLEEVEQFIRVMLSTAAEDARIFTILTMRSEFIENCGGYPELAEAMNEGLYLLPRATKEELRTAVVAPIQKAGAAITIDLLNQLLDDSLPEADGLPILQHALAQLWPERKSFEPLGMDLYKARGGLGSFIDEHAEKVYSSKGMDGAAAEALFRAIVEVSDEGRTLRRPLTIEEISKETGVSPDRLKLVVKAFQDEGFLRIAPAGSPDQLIDLTHEAIARQWSRYKKWTEKERQARRAMNDVRKAALEFGAHEKHQKDYLVFQGQRLDDLEARLSNAVSRLSPQEQQFLAKCRANSRWNRIFSRPVVLAALLGVILISAVTFWINYAISEAEIARTVLETTKKSAEAAELTSRLHALQLESEARNAQTLLRLVQSPTVAAAATPSAPILYPQIWTDDQKKLIDAVRDALPGVRVEKPEIVSVGPLSDELRYFFKSDEAQATQIAAKIAQAGGPVGSPKYIQGFENKIRPGHFELWLKRPGSAKN
jgi:hypothetical protein